MIFGKRHRYKLPKFPEAVSSLFHSYCEDLPLESLPAVREELDGCIKALYELSEENSLIDKAMIDPLYKCSLFLLERYENYNHKQRALAIGAIRYFVILDDGLPDDAFTSGLLDDAQVMNYVLEQLGEDEMIISL